MNPTAIGLRAMRVLASAETLDKLGIRQQVEKVVYRSTRDGFKAAGSAGKTFVKATSIGKAARQRTAGSDYFDLTPNDDQQMLVENFREFAAARLRPAALDADAAAMAPKELLDEVNELGLTMLGVPEELGGVMEERAAVTTVLAAEALAHGDMGLAVAALAPAGVANALSLWGDADQQSTYLPTLVGESVPAAAIALLEPRALFDPFDLRTTARRDGGDYVLSGVKAMVPRAVDADLLIVGAKTEDGRNALFLVEEGVLAKPSPAMGVRAAATGEVLLEDLRVPASALLGEADPEVYADCVRRGRLAWCALSVGCAQAVLDYVIPYVNERKAFGEPISHRQAVAFAVSDIAVELGAMRLTTYRAAARADAGKDFSREVALARALCSEKGTNIGSEGVQLLGGHGYVKEHPVERWFRDLRATGIMEGGLLA